MLLDMEKTESASYLRLISALARLRPEVKGTSDIAKLFDVSPQTINNFKSRGVSKDFSLEAQNRYGINASYISGDDEAVFISQSAVKEPKADYNVPVQLNVGLVPLVSSVQAGEWSEIVDNFAPGDAEDWIPCVAKHSPQTIALRVEGESMHAPGERRSYASGDIIFVDPNREAKSGDRVVVRLEGQKEATFKQLVIEDGKVLLKALNPDWKPRYLEVNSAAHMVGVVIGKWVSE
jgi:SOS-response transcriptional repressor LexA